MTEINQSWVNVVGPLFGIVFGLVGAIFNKRLGQKAAEFQKNVFHIHVSETATRGAQIGYLVLGIVFVVAGVLNLLRLWW
jgi:hypothetical protein